MALWFGISRPPSRALSILAVIGLFALIGPVHYAIIGSRLDRWWVKYVIISADITLLAAVAAFAPLSESGEIPQDSAFRNDTFHLFYVVLAVAAFSLAPGLVLWSGIAITAAVVGRLGMDRLGHDPAGRLDRHTKCPHSGAVPLRLL